jgi:hypothetical protein
MKTNILTKNLILAISLLSLTFSACKDKNENFFPTPESHDNISGTTIKYTIQLSSGANPADSVLSVFGAKVILNMNDSVYQKTVDSTGMISFNNLADGNLVVRIEHPLFYTYNYIVDLHPDSTHYNSTNYRNVSDIVRLVPKTNILAATLQGNFYADIDQTQTGYEKAPQGISLNVLLSDSSQNTLAQISDGGNILDSWLEMPALSTQTNATGSYSLRLPVANIGLKYIIRPANFYALRTDALGNQANALFQVNSKEIELYTPQNQWLNFYYTEGLKK